MAWYDQYGAAPQALDLGPELSDEELRIKYGLAPKAAQEQDGGFFSAIGQGALAGLEGQTAFINQLAGGTQVGDAIVGKLSTGQKYLLDQMAPEYREAAAKHWLSDEPDETFGEAWGDPYAYANIFGQALGSLGVIIATGGPLKGLLTKAIGKTALKETSKKAATAVAGAGAYGAAEMAMVGGMTGRAVREELEQMDDATWNEAPLFQSRFWALHDGGMSVEEARGKAKEDVIANLEEAATFDGGNLLVSLALGSVAGRFIDKAMSGALKGAGRGKAAVIGAITEAPTEAGQGGMEQYTQNMYVGQVDPSIAATRGVAEAAVAEAIGGAGAGAALGGITGGTRARQPASDRTLTPADTAPAMETYVNQPTEQMDLLGMEVAPDETVPAATPEVQPRPASVPQQSELPLGSSAAAQAEPTPVPTATPQSEQLAADVEKLQQQYDEQGIGRQTVGQPVAGFQLMPEDPAPTPTLQQTIEAFNLPLQLWQEEKGRPTGGRPNTASREQLESLDGLYTTLVSALEPLAAQGYDVSGLKKALRKANGNRPITGTDIQRRGGQPITGRIKGGDIVQFGGRSKRTPPGGWQRVADELFTSVYTELNNMLRHGPKTMPQRGLEIPGDRLPVKEEAATTPEQPTGVVPTALPIAQKPALPKAPTVLPSVPEDAPSAEDVVAASQGEEVDSDVEPTDQEVPEGYETTPEEEAAILAERKAKAQREKAVTDEEAAAEAKAQIAVANKQSAAIVTSKKRRGVKGAAAVAVSRERTASAKKGKLSLSKKKPAPAPEKPEAKKPEAKKPEAKKPEAKKEEKVWGSKAAQARAEKSGLDMKDIETRSGRGNTIILADIDRALTRRRLAEESKLLKEAMNRSAETVRSLDDAQADVSLGAVDGAALMDAYESRLDAAEAMEIALNPAMGGQDADVPAASLIRQLLTALEPADPMARILQRLLSSGATLADVTVMTREEIWERSGSRVDKHGNAVVPAAHFDVRRGADRRQRMHIQLNEAIVGTERGLKSFVHELVHGATSLGLTTDNKLARKLDGLRLQARRYLRSQKLFDEADMYGFKNVDEFLAEALSNEQFQRVLAGIPVKTNSNLLTELFRAIADFFGFSNEPNVLAGTLALAEGLVMSPEQTADALARGGRQYIHKGEPIDAATGDIQGWMRGDFDADRAKVVRTIRSLSDDGLASTAGKVYDSVVSKTGIDPAEYTRGLSRVGLGLHTLDQLVRRFRAQFASPEGNALVKYWNIVREKATLARDEQQRAEAINQVWRELEKRYPDIARKLAKLMHDTTVLGMHPDVPLNHPLNSHIKVTPTTRQQHAELQAVFNSLGDQGRGVYRKVRSFYQDQRSELRRATLTHIANANNVEKVLGQRHFETIVNATSPADIEAIDFSAYEKHSDSLKTALMQSVALTSVKGPYFPLRRHGKYVIEGKRAGVPVGPVYQSRKDAWEKARSLRATNPTSKIRTRQLEDGSYRNERIDHVVEMYDSISEAKAAAEALTAEGYRGVSKKADVVTVGFKQDWNLPPGSAANTLLAQAKRKFETDSPQAKALDTAFLELLLENNVRKSELRRKKVAGASMDMRRAFAERAYAGSWGIADIRTALGHQDAIRQVAKAAKDNFHLGELLKELRIRDERSLAERKVSGFDRVASKLGFVWYLLSPSYTVVNLTQVPLVAAPYLTGKYGARANVALFKSYRGIARAAAKEWGRVKGGVSGPPTHILDAVRAELDTGERAMMDQLANYGIIDATFMQDLYETTQGTKETKGKLVHDKIMDIARTSPQVAEVVNRVVVARAAYNLEMEKSGDVRQATEAASEAVLQTQFDYTDQNKPRYFKAFPGARAIMMFKMYAQGMYALMLNNVTRMARGTPAERKEARTIFAGLIASHTLAAGVLGGVFIEPLRAIIGLAALAFDDDDEPWSLDQEVTKALAEMTSPQAAELIARGVSRSIGIDLAGRLGLNNMAFMGIRDARSSQEWYTNAIIAAGGPVVATGMSIARGFDYASKGNLYRGIESGTPKLIRDALRAARYADTGMMDYNGNIIAGRQKFDTGDSIAQALGFTPTIAARTFEGRFAQTRARTKLADRRKRLMQQWRGLDPKERVVFFRNNIVPFNQKNPDFSIKVDHLLRSLIEQRRRESLTRAGAYADRQQVRNAGAPYDF